MTTRGAARTPAVLVALLVAALGVSLLPTGSASGSPAQTIEEARRELAALNVKVDLAVEDYNGARLALAAARTRAATARGRVTREEQQLADLRRSFGTLAAEAYRSGGSDQIVLLVNTGSPQTFLDRAATLDHLASTRVEKIRQLEVARRELAGQQVLAEQVLAEQQRIERQLAESRTFIESAVQRQQQLLTRLETQEARRLRLAEEARIAELARQEAARQALAEARAEQARALARARAERAARAARAAAAARERAAAAARAARLASAARAQAARAEALRAARAAAASAARARRAKATARSTVRASGGVSATSSPSSRASIAVREAYAQLGKPYVWAAAGPDSFDCSGLTMWVWGKAGVSLPHYSRAQFNAGVHVSQSELRPGDLVFYGSPIHHVGIYVGGGRYIAAPQTGDVVKISNVNRSDWAGAVRL